MAGLPIIARCRHWASSASDECASSGPLGPPLFAVGAFWAFVLGGIALAHVRRQLARARRARQRQSSGCAAERRDRGRRPVSVQRAGGHSAQPAAARPAADQSRASMTTSIASSVVKNVLPDWQGTEPRQHPAAGHRQARRRADRRHALGHDDPGQHRSGREVGGAGVAPARHVGQHPGLHATRRLHRRAAAHQRRARGRRPGAGRADGLRRLRRADPVLRAGRLPRLRAAGRRRRRRGHRRRLRRSRTTSTRPTTTATSASTSGPGRS